MRSLPPSQLARVREIALALEGTEEGSSYGTPGFKVRGKLFARVHQDGESLVVRVDPFERDLLLKTNPGTFFLTDHYVDYPWVLIRLVAAKREVLRKALENAWRIAGGPPKGRRKR